MAAAMCTLIEMMHLDLEPHTSLHDCSTLHCTLAPRLCGKFASCAPIRPGGFKQCGGEVSVHQWIGFLTTCLVNQATSPCAPIRPGGLLSRLSLAGRFLHFCRNARRICEVTYMPSSDGSNELPRYMPCSDGAASCSA